MLQNKWPCHLIKESQDNWDHDGDGNYQSPLSKPNFLSIRLEECNHGCNPHEYPDTAENNEDDEYWVLHFSLAAFKSVYLQIRSTAYLLPHLVGRFNGVNLRSHPNFLFVECSTKSYWKDFSDRLLSYFRLGSHTTVEVVQKILPTRSPAQSRLILIPHVLPSCWGCHASARCAVDKSNLH